MNSILGRRAKSCICVTVFLLVNWVMTRAFLAAAERWDLDLFRTLCHKNVVTVPKVVLAGDSHVAFGISHELAPSTINVAGLGEGFQVTYYKLRYLFDKFGGAIRLVCVEAGPQAFGGERLATNQEYPYGLAIDYVDSLRHSDDPLHTLRLAIPNAIFNYYDLPTRIDAKLVFTAAAANPPSFRDERTRREKAPAVVRKHFPNPGEWWSPEMAYYFEQILVLCRERNIPIALVQMPISKEYYDVLAKTVPLGEFESRVRGILANWPEVELFDYQTIFFDESNLFFDLDHLDGEGVHRITERLRNDLESTGMLP